MRIKKDSQIFNLMDTNGRRNDVVNALQGYLSILNDVQNGKRMKWACLPGSLAQYEFYRQAIRRSPEVFKQHGPYDQLQKAMERHPDFRQAVRNRDIGWIREHRGAYEGLIRQFDKGIEDRARHYTSNLVKLGLADEDRRISPAGELLLDLKGLKRDPLERLLPIDGVNLVYLRQLLKLRIFDGEGRRYYAPFPLAVFALLKRRRLSENAFLELVQGLGPYSNFGGIEGYVESYQEGRVVEESAVEIPGELCGQKPVAEEVFRLHFRNRKSGAAVDIYWEFYGLLWNVWENPGGASMEALLGFYEANRPMLNKAFGGGQNLFPLKLGERPSPEDFREQLEDLFGTQLNQALYSRFARSKKLDQIREYSDTTKRIFKATGMIRFDNGYAELAYLPLCQCIFREERLKAQIAGRIDSYEDRPGEAYEEGADSYFCGVTGLAEILGHSQKEILKIQREIQKAFPFAGISEIPKIVADQRRQEFARFIETAYPRKKVKEILGLFEDRGNDGRIKELVSPDATVPTIYEYMVGIAWYYFSGRRIDLLESYNLTLSADFEPLVHAGGGQGDIVIYEKDQVVMLEATLMNAGSQKRGEWEPVLRHSINLKVEEETAGTGRQVTTFFIADQFDANTINIWKAVASVPLQSSVDQDKFTDNVVIMPVQTQELCALMDQTQDYDEIISKVHQLFEVDQRSFDMSWREKFMEVVTGHDGGLLKEMM